VVESADRVYAITIRRSSGEAALVIDGRQEVLPVTERHRIPVRRAPVHFCLVKVPGHSYYQTLRDKLHWGTPPQYRGDG